MTLAPSDRAAAPALIDQITRQRKEKYLKDLREADFRDKVVRPLLERKGVQFLRDTCGPTEEGKDCVCVGQDPLGRRIVYAIQTKRGDLKMSRKLSDNVAVAITQIQTALTADIYLTQTKEKVKPGCVLLFVSGIINDSARRHIHDNVRDTRIDFRDCNDLIPEIDKLYPELWYGIDAQKFPYFRRLQEHLIGLSDAIGLVADRNSSSTHSPVTDDAYVTLFAYRITEEIHKRKGEVERRPKFDQIPVHEVITRPDKLVWLTGEGGSGKTTALRRIAYALAGHSLSTSQVSYVPILAKANELDLNVNMVDNLGQISGRLTPNGRPCFSSDDLASGRVVVLIDALDEVLHDDHRELVLSKLAAFHEQYPSCTIILTSRDYASLRRMGGFRGFVRYQLESLDLRQAAKIVDRAADGQRVPKDQVKETLRRLQDVHGISLSPLIVTVFVASSDFSKKDIPPNITEIFKKFTEQMLGRWDERKGVAQQYQTPLKDFLLTQLAARLHYAKRRSTTLGECRDIWDEALRTRGHSADIEVLFNEIVHRSSLLRIDGDTVEFRHHILQEFFAGRAIKDPNSFKDVVDDEWWRKPIIFHFGDRADNADGILNLMDSTAGMPADRAYEAAITLGLAIQACYLAETTSKADGMHWVVRTLASACDSFIAQQQDRAKNIELASFIWYYLAGRDAVACDVVANVAQTVTAELRSAADAEIDRLNRELFWCIAGLIDANRLSDAEQLLKGFNPADRRLLMAIHLGCFHVSHLRISNEQNKKIATRLYKQIGPKVASLIEQTMKEWRSYLLEIRRGEIKAIDSTASDSTETENS